MQKRTPINLLWAAKTNPKETFVETNPDIVARQEIRISKVLRVDDLFYPARETDRPGSMTFAVPRCYLQECNQVLIQSVSEILTVPYEPRHHTQAERVLPPESSPSADNYLAIGKMHKQIVHSFLPDTQ